MCSPRNAIWIAAVLLSSCGNDVGDNNAPDGGGITGDAMSCATSYLTYVSFGDGFMEDWCRGCHSANLPDDMRQGSPTDVNFDTLAEVQTWSAGILADATGMTITMPIAGGPSDQDRDLLAAWLECGAP
jgi:uncharacterized membrane protein